jgi:hypothetical protein
MEDAMTQQERQDAKKIFAAAKASSAPLDENGNPIRTSLTQPPAEYRVPDPEAPDEFTTQDGKKKKKGIWPFR